MVMGMLLLMLLLEDCDKNGCERANQRMNDERMKLISIALERFPLYQVQGIRTVRC